MTYRLNESSLDSQTTPRNLVAPSFFARVMAWLMASFAATGLGLFLFGPFIPSTWVLPLSFLVLAVLLASAFVKNNQKIAAPLAIGIPMLLGAITYPLLNYYVTMGAGDLIILSAAGALVIFGGMALWGWTTKKDVSGWGKPLFIITLGLIAMSILNIFMGASWLGLLVAGAVLVVFSLWTIHDVQSLKSANSNGTTAHPATYALNLWLNIWNLFMALLRIFSHFR